MSISKTECRKHGGQPLRIRANDGLIRAESVEWLVTSAVKIIAHRRTLVLNLYSRIAASKGDFAPRFTLFHTKDDYITLEYKTDGGTAWRTGSFDRVTGHWEYAKYCAFVSLSDEQRVTRYFAYPHRAGFHALKQAQYAIQDQRRAKREKQKQRKMRERMSCVPVIPHGLKEWVRRYAMPAYLLIDKQNCRKPVQAVCSACGKAAELTGAKHNAETICPHCGREATIKSKGRMKSLYDRETCQVIQKTAPNELVIRIFKFEGDAVTGSLRFYESARQFIRQEADGELSHEDYYNNCGKWKAGIRPVYICYQYQFYADTKGHVYTGNLPRALQGTPWEYCPVAAFYGHFKECIQIRPFLAAHLKHPRLEHLVKTGFCTLASDLAYRDDGQALLDETQNRNHQILGVAAEDVTFLRELDADMATLRIFSQYNGLKDRRKLLLWQMKHEVKQAVSPILRHTTAHKMMRYLEQQQANSDTQHQWRYNSMQNLVTEYRDYLEMSEKLGDDLTNTFVLFPKNLTEAHDTAAARQKIKLTKELRRDFRIAYKRVMSHLDFERDGLKMVYPTDPEEIIHEGQALHHCVANYVDKVAKKECLILFLRQCDEPEKPFYTVEVRNRKIAQVHGYGNADPTPEVNSFMAAWEHQVLQAAA